MKQHENIKDSIFAKAAVDKQILKLKNIFLPALHSLGIGGILAFLFLNLVSSQTISPYFFGFVNNDRAATVGFLQKIKDLPDYQNILKMHDIIYGKSIRAEIYSEESKKKALINNLEQQLFINPKARDILYSLYQLYLTEGDKNKSNYYLQRAKEVDPSIVY